MSTISTRDTRSKSTILKYFDKTEDDLQECVTWMNNWFKKQPHFTSKPNTNTIEFFILNNNFDLTEAKSKIDAYYSLRTTLATPFEYSNPTTPEMQATVDSAQVIPLPRLLDDLYGIIVVKVREYVPEELDAHWWLGAALNVHEIHAQENMFINYVIIYDQQNITLDHILKLSPMFILNCSKMADKGMGEKIKAVHFVNNPPVFQFVMRMCKSLLDEEIYNRLHLHTSIDSFTENFPVDILPKDYGGNEKCLDELEEIFLKKYKEYKDHFETLDALKIDESVRPRADQNDEILSFAENFKKLLFD